MKYPDAHHYHADQRLGIRNAVPGKPISQAFSAGFHPMEINEKFPTEEDWDILSSQLHSKYAVAVGECGLDSRNAVHMPQQKEALHRQLALAKDLNLPVILHCVRAYHELEDSIRRYRPRFMLHAFNKKPEVAHRLVKLGGYLSFGPDVMKYTSAVESLLSAPLDKILIETDESTLPIQNIYAFCAERLNMELTIFAQQIESNFYQFLSPSDEKSQMAGADRTPL